MSKSRVPGAQRKTSGSPEIGKPPVFRYLGLSLSGGKADKSCLAVLEVYPAQKRIFLSKLYEKIRSEDSISADGKIIEMVGQMKDSKAIAFDAPLSLPNTLICDVDSPGYESRTLPEEKWMQELHESQPKKRPRRIFTPYTQRPIDMYLSVVEEENLDVQHTMGANLAPLAARAQYLSRRLSVPAVEVFPKLAVWRMGLEMRVSKAHLRAYRNSIGGEEARRIFMQALVEKAGLFVYQQDFRALCDNPHAFDALVSAWVAFLKDEDKTETPPKGFPKTAAWVEFPKRKSLPF